MNFHHLVQCETSHMNVVETQTREQKKGIVTDNALLMNTYLKSRKSKLSRQPLTK